MSTEDKMPTVKDTAIPVFPITFFKGDEAPNTTDWRPEILPADAPEEDAAPKAVSAPEPVESSESPKKIEPMAPDAPAQHPAGEGTGLPKVENPGQPASSGQTTTGKAKPPVKAAPPSGTTRSAANPS